MGELGDRVTLGCLSLGLAVGGLVPSAERGGLVARPAEAEPDAWPEPEPDA